MLADWPAVTKVAVIGTVLLVETDEEAGIRNTPLSRALQNR